jgi:Mlc titration factor MtfA (ptsG expression regulator)
VFKKWRERRQLEAGGFPDAWRAVITANVAHWKLFDDEERARLEDTAMVLMLYKRWEAARGFALTDEMRITIAAQAAVLVLGFDDDEYVNVNTIIVHPSTIVFHHEQPGPAGTIMSGPDEILGQAHFSGPILIAWDTALTEARHPERGRNVVYHEFAHKLDMMDGLVDGTPPLAADDRRRHWAEVCTEEYEYLRANPDPLLVDYAATNPAEFFAVVTEVFFCTPQALEEAKPKLYDVLRDYYAQDPAARERRAVPNPPASH